MKVPRRSKDDRNSLPADVLPKVLERSKSLCPQHYAVLFIGMTTGMRWSELSALAWEDIDEGAGLIRLRAGEEAPGHDEDRR